MNTKQPLYNLRPATTDDLDPLLRLEERCFSVDRLSRRSFRHWLSVEHRIFLLAEVRGQLAGYVLIILLRGTRLARLYSVAVDNRWRGLGIARALISAGEDQAKAQGKLFLRLEVSTDNKPGIQLYESMGYKRFGIYRDYYQDHGDALRLQKTIRQYPSAPYQSPLPWIPQTTKFTCGPAALMMAMKGIDDNYQPSIVEEMRIWREATTIFMTSGHGGCHPIGLALAAKARGFAAEVWINQKGPLFIDGVRDENKKRVITLTHEDFCQEAQEQGVPVHYRELLQQNLTDAFAAGAIPVILVSTYQMDRKKAPHWVTMSGFDQDCLYLQDPDMSEQDRIALDSQQLPIARNDFEQMSRFGRNKLRCAVIVKKKQVFSPRRKDRQER